MARKLTVDQVETIQNEAIGRKGRYGGYTQQELAWRYGVSVATIRRAEKTNLVLLPDYTMAFA